MDSAVEGQVAPMRIEIAKARNDLAEEKLRRLTERQQFAAMWPHETHVPPATLRRYKPVSPDELAKLRADAIAAEADAAIRREIRAKIAEASRWTQVTDDYGRQYYAHTDTGEASWEPPEAMLYEPPPGRDELGNVILVVDEDEQSVVVEETREDEKVTAPKKEDDAAVWEEKIDQWGQKVWKHRITGATTTKPPAVQEKPQKQKEESSDSDDDSDRPPIATDGISYFHQRTKERAARMQKRKKRAVLAARRALTYLEEAFAANIAQRKDDPDIPPAFVDVEALRDLAKGDDDWVYMSREAKRIHEAKLEEERLKHELFQQEEELKRKAAIKKALTERQKTTGLGAKLAKKASSRRGAHHHMSSDSSDDNAPGKAAVLAMKKKLSAAEEKLKATTSKKMKKERSRSEAYYTLGGGGGGGGGGTAEDFDEDALDELRHELEATAKDEERIMVQLNATRRRLEAISLRLLRVQTPVALVAEAPVPAEAPTDPIAPAAAPVAADPLRPAITEEVPPAEHPGEETWIFRAGIDGTLPEPQCEAWMAARTVWSVATEAVWAGLSGDAPSVVVPANDDDAAAVDAFFEGWHDVPSRETSLVPAIAERERCESPDAEALAAAAGKATLDVAKAILNGTLGTSEVDSNLRAAEAFIQTSRQSPEFADALDAVRKHRVVAAVVQAHVNNGEKWEPLQGQQAPEVVGLSPEDAQALKATIEARVTDARQYAEKIAELLELGTTNALPEQIRALQGSEDAPKENDGGFLENLFAEKKQQVLDEAEAERREPMMKKKRRRRRKTGAALLDEATSLHEKTLGWLMKEASELGLEAARDSDARLGDLEEQVDDVKRSGIKLKDAQKELHQRIRTLEMRLEAVGGGAQAFAEQNMLEQWRSDEERLKNNHRRSLDDERKLSFEVDAERERGIWLEAQSRHVAVVRVAHDHERQRQAETVVQLQESLHTVFNEYRRASEELKFGGDRGVLERLAASRVALVSLREKLRNEGRRRRWLREDELAFFRYDVRRLAEDRAAQLERRMALAVVATARQGCANAHSAIDAHNVAAVAAGLNVDDLHDPRIAGAYATLAAVEGSRTIARRRERRHRREAGALGRQAAKLAAPLPPVSDDNIGGDKKAAELLAKHRRVKERGTEDAWATTATLLKMAREDVQRAWAAALRSAKRADREIVKRRRSKMKSLDVIRKLDAKVRKTRTEAQDLRLLAVEAGLRALKSTAKTAVEAEDRAQKEQSAAARESLKESRARDEAEEELKKQLDDARQRGSTLFANVRSLQYSLSCERSEREILDKKVQLQMDQLAQLRCRVRDELRAERAHSARVELWVHGMLAGFGEARRQVAHREMLLDHQQVLDKTAQKMLKKNLWHQTQAAHLIGLDVDALMLFFAQRLAALAGAHASFNDRLRANGAALILAALCQSPRSELRRLGAKALANFAWNGHVDSRSLGTTIRDQWTYWTAVAKKREVSTTKNRPADTMALELAEPGDVPEKLTGQFTKAMPTQAQLARMTPRDVAVARRQWAVRHRRACEGPNHANMKVMASPTPANTATWLLSSSSSSETTTTPPLVATLLNLVHDRDQDCVLAVAGGLAAASYDADNARTLGSQTGIVEAVMVLAKHENPEVVALACDAGANLSYRQEPNQRALGEKGFIDLLVALLRHGAAASSSKKKKKPGRRVEEEKTDFDTDVAESASCALANVLSLHVPNSTRFAEAGGLEVLFDLLNSPIIVNLLDVDQAMEIQANAANALANAAAGLGSKTAFSVQDTAGEIVRLLASELISAKIAASLLIGNLARDAKLQDEFGRFGAMEGLWGTARDARGPTQQICSVWALANLVWASRSNQDRSTRLLDGVLRLLKKDDTSEDWFPGKICGANLLANALHYHDVNRHHVEVIPNGVETVLERCDVREPTAMREAALRCMISLTATDRGARRVLNAEASDGSTACVALIVAAGDPTEGDKMARVRRYGVIALANLCLLLDARDHVKLAGGLEILVAVSACPDREARDAATMAMQALQHKIGEPKIEPLEIQPSGDENGAKALVDLLKATPESSLAEPGEDEVDADDKTKPYFASERAQTAKSSAVWARTTGARSLAKEDSPWLTPENLEDLFHQGGLEALFSTVSDYYGLDDDASSGEEDLVILTLEAIYNCVRYADPRDVPQELVSNLKEDGVPLLMTVSRHAAHEKRPRVLEGALRALVPVITDFAPTSRRLLAVGLDFLLDVAESDDDSFSPIHRDLAAVLLKVLAPFNLIVCTNCGTANRGGFVCVYCGHPLTGEQQQEN